MGAHNCDAEGMIFLLECQINIKRLSVFCFELLLIQFTLGNNVISTCKLFYFSLFLAY